MTHRACFFLLLPCLLGLPCSLPAAERPNILFFFVDDWGRYASSYAEDGKPSLSDVIQTPTVDRVAREGVIFDNAFVPVASCGPCRASLATGRYFWNCGSGAFLNGKASDWSGHDNPFPKMTKFPDLLRESGYHARKSLKTISFTESKDRQGGQGVPKVEYERYGLYVGEAVNEADRAERIEKTLLHPRLEMRRVLQEATAVKKPFFFIYGTINVHRPYTPGSGESLWGIDPDSLKGRIPEFLPDVEEIRRDFADYLGEVQAADAMLGEMLDELEKAGQLDDTLVLLSGDHGIPGVPRGKTNCYDLAIRAPMMARLPGTIPAGRRVSDFVSVMDVGPTLLDLAGLTVPETMNGRSFLRQLTSTESGWIDDRRDWVVIGRELHYHTARDGNLPYPMRAIRTRDHLFIKNFKPDRWPMGAPYNLDQPETIAKARTSTVVTYRDLDASLTKGWLLENRASTDAAQSIKQTLGKRPPRELYSVSNDPDHMHNLADEAEAAERARELEARLMNVLEATVDPRLDDAFDTLPYVAPLKNE